jgi:hypothetical protein
VDREPEVELAPSVVAFVDVLGTRVMGTNEIAELKRLLSARNRAADYLDSMPSYDIVSFTDNTVLRWHSHIDDGSSVNPALAWLPDELAALQLAFCVDGLFLRGGIEAGGLAIGAGFVFGDALNRAVMAEHNDAHWPRIVLSADVVDLVSEATAIASDHPETELDSLLRDEDGSVFVNYLAWTAKSEPVFHLRKHGEWVVRRLQENRDKPAVTDKYRWISDYHNYAAAALGLPDETIDVGNSGRLFYSV